MGGARIGGGIGWLLLRKFLHIFFLFDNRSFSGASFFISHFSFFIFHFVVSSFVFFLFSVIFIFARCL